MTQQAHPGQGHQSRAVPHQGGTLLVSPVYLAGATGADPVGPLLDNAGWSRARLNTDAYYTSGCQRLRAARRRTEWTFVYSADPLGMPVWAAHFSPTTPDEVLSSFTRVLLDGLDAYFIPHLTRDRGVTPASIFHAHDWRPVHGARPWHTTSPDQTAAFHIAIHTGPIDTAHELQVRSAATWRITAGPEPVTRPSWSAWFTGHTPQPLMIAIARTVTDPAPVARRAHLVPAKHRTLLTLHPATSATDTARPHRFANPAPPVPATSPQPSTPRTR
ncbi:DUF317 domain-containing protein [Streptomyces diacarni]|uniref:DUF317 domain-containing protein n=1 Tax=Streptomyces diacarni TaxID=2800381 RepID=UPI0033C11FE9